MCVCTRAKRGRHFNSGKGCQHPIRRSCLFLCRAVVGLNGMLGFAGEGYGKQAKHETRLLPWVPS